MICRQKYFHKSIHISLFDKYFYKNKKSKLCFGDYVTIQNDFLYEYRGSTYYLLVWKSCSYATVLIKLIMEAYLEPGVLLKVTRVTLSGSVTQAYGGLFFY